MEPIPFFYESIDRNAIVVKPKKPFYSWVNSIFPDDKPIEEKDENSIYLIEEMMNNELVLNWIKRNFEMIFVNELNDWCTDEDKWPKRRTYKMFSDWFKVEISSMILDLEEYDITKE